MGSCEHSNEPSDSMKGREFLDRQAVSSSGRALLHGVSKMVGQAGSQK
jgi:hypothetical protein